MLEVWVTSQSDTMKTILDGIAAFFNQNGGSLFLYLVTSLGFLTMVIRYIIQQPDVRQVVNWLIVVSTIPVVLINPTKKVIVHDSTSPLEMHPVDNIPLGLAYPLSIITTAMHSATKVAEDAMHMPHDQGYLSTGMVYASKIFEEMNSLQPDADLMGYWSQFLYMCIDPNVRVRHRYTYKQLFDAPNIMQFLKDNTIDGFNRIHLPAEKGKEAQNPEDDWPHCRTALDRLEQRFKDSTAFNFKTMGAFDPLNRVKTAAEIENDVQGVGGMFFKLSGSSQEMMMQNLLINATKNGFKNIAAQKNQMAAALNYAETQNDMNAMSGWAVMAKQAQKYIPMMQTILLMLICCAFIPVIYVSMLPGMTYRVLTTYGHSLLWVTSWGLFYIFINFIMTAFMKYRLNAFTDVFGGITLSNIDGTKALLSNYTTLTGSFLMLTPYLARLVILGAAQTMGGLVTSMQSTISANAQKAADGVGTGNYNVFSTNTANHGANNASFNKQNFDHEERFGNDTRATHLGGSETLGATGRVYRDNRISHLATQINQNEAITSGLNEGANTHRQQSFAEARQAQQSWNTTLGNLATVNDTDAMRHARQASQGNTKSMTTDQAYANMVGLTQRFGQDEINSAMSGWSAEQGGSLSLGTGKAFKFFGAEIHAKGAFNQSGTDTTSHSTSMSTEDQETLRQSMSVLSQSTQSELASAEKNLGVDKNHSIQSSLTEAKTHGENASREDRIANDYQQAATYAESQGSSVTYNDIPQFESWLENKVSKEGAGYYLNDPQMQSSPEFKNLIHDYQQEAATKFKSSYEANKADIETSSGADIDKRTADKIIHNKAEVLQANHDNNATVENQYQQKTRDFEGKVNDTNPDIAGKAVNKTLDEHGFKSQSFKANNPSSLNQTKFLPPKMYIAVDQQGRELNSRVDALRAQVVDKKLSNFDRLKRQEKQPELGSLEAENDLFLKKF